MGEEGGNAGGLRIDRWLWQARFYKSRALATEAVAGGHVRLNGVRVKPARVVQPGDRLEVSRGGRVLECVVRAIPARRGPAPEARLAYEETPESIARGERHAEAMRLGAGAAPRPEGRPDKRERRQLRALEAAQRGTGMPAGDDAEAHDWDDDPDEAPGDPLDPDRDDRRR